MISICFEKLKKLENLIKPKNLNVRNRITKNCYFNANN